jgi:hypothetical protein
MYIYMYINELQVPPPLVTVECPLLIPPPGTPDTPAIMSKEANDVEVISAVAPDISSYPIVAEGTGKTAQNEGARAKTVYNVSKTRTPLACEPARAGVTDPADCRLSCTRLSRSPR